MLWRLLLVVSVASAASAQTAPVSARDAMRAAMEKQRSAAAQQREAIRKQAESLGVWVPPNEAPSQPAAPPSPPPSPPQAINWPCDAIDDATIAPIVEAAAKAQSIEPRLLRAVIEQESGLHPCAVSPKGAKGLMQLMPDTAQELGVADVFDPKQNVEGGAKYLKQLLAKYGGDLSQALGAYNAGPGTVDQAGGIPNISETRDYVNSILKKLGSPKPP